MPEPSASCEIGAEPLLFSGRGSRDPWAEGSPTLGQKVTLPFPPRSRYRQRKGQVTLAQASSNIGSANCAMIDDFKAIRIPLEVNHRIETELFAPPSTHLAICDGGCELGVKA